MGASKEKPMRSNLFFVINSAVLSIGLAIPAVAQQPAASDLFVGIHKSTILENAAGVKRISIASSEVAEAVAVSKTEVLVNGKAPGDTSLILWDLNNQRTTFTVHVTTGDSQPDDVRSELRNELKGQDVTFDLSNGTVFLHGLVNDVTSADRAAAIASTLGRVVNLLNVKVPEAEPQILLKVRFANLDRTAAQQIGLNIISTGATNTIGGITTGQFGQQPTFDFTQNPFTTTFNNLLNVFLLRRDLNLGAAIEALEQKQVVQILAEPNLLTVSGRPASFLAGGEFPYPTLQGGGAGVGQITIQFREFGIRIHFEPTITPRGTIRLAVTPEVSSLDYANGLTVSGFTVPGLDTRRIQTEVDLESGQSFIIAGLLDNRTTVNLSKIPGLGNIPLLGKLFESRSIQKNNTELLVLVTPELVRPIPAGTKPPGIQMPRPFMKESAPSAPQTPVQSGIKAPSRSTVPLETLRKWGSPAPAGLGSNGNSGYDVKPILQMTPPPDAGTTPGANK